MKTLGLRSEGSLEVWHERPCERRSRGTGAPAFYVVLVLFTTGLVLMSGLAESGGPISSLGRPAVGLFEDSRTVKAHPLGWPVFGAPNVTVNFTGAYPSVTLTLDHNPSIQVTLVIEHILEVESVPTRRGQASVGPLGLLAREFAPLGAGTPFHVAVSGSVNASQGVWVNMSGQVAVRSLSTVGYAGIPVWQAPDGEIPVSAIGPVVGSVSVSVSFHIDSLGGVNVGLYVSAWPWVSSTDSLALEWEYFLPLASGTQGVSCTNISLVGPQATTPCSGGSVLVTGEPQWINSSSAIEAVQGGGLLSYLKWNNQGTAQTSQGIGPVLLNDAVFPVSGSNRLRVMQVVAPGVGAVSNFSEDPTVGLVPSSFLNSPSALVPMFQGNAEVFLVGAAVALIAIVVIRTVRKSQEQERLRKF